MSLKLFLIHLICPYKIKYYFLKQTYAYVHACSWLYKHMNMNTHINMFMALHLHRFSLFKFHVK